METILEWHSPEHHFDKKSKDWYWILGVIAVGASVLAFYFGNFLFGIFIIIAGVTLGMLSHKETKIILVRIVHKGIIFNKQLHPWMSYKSFWIEDEHTHGFRILMHPTSSYLPITVIPVNGEIDLNDVRDVLLEFLEEEFLEESVIHKWFDKILDR